MREPYTQLYVHLVWATWDRAPIISAAIKNALYAAIADKCKQLKCVTLVIGGIEDHCHVLVQHHPAVSISDLVREVKGSSSHMVNHVLSPEFPFKWQGSYGAFTLRKEGVPDIQRYIENQEAHHRGGKVLSTLEMTETP